MNWDAIGAVGEVLGALGVILTLGYLAVQIRVNTKAMNNQSIHDAQEFVTVSCLPLVEDAEVTEIYVRGMKSFEDLNEIEQVRFHYLCTQRIHAAAANMNLLHDKASNRETQFWIERMMRNDGFRAWWLQRGQWVVATPFRVMAEEIRLDVESNALDEKPSLGETYRAPEIAS